MGLLEPVVAEPQPLHRAGPEILDHDISARDEGARVRFAGLAFQVDRDALLVAIHGGEGRRIVDAPPATEGVAARRLLHLDDIGAEIAKQHARIGARNVIGELNHPDACKRAFHNSSHQICAKLIGGESALQAARRQRS